jgi:hypothetical protein
MQQPRIRVTRNPDTLVAAYFFSFFSFFLLLFFFRAAPSHAPPPPPFQEYGATVLLNILLAGSGAILKRLVNDSLLDRFKDLIKKIGPMPRLINLFASVCFVENRPVRQFQEQCCRKLWLNPHDRYSIGCTLHEMINMSDAEMAEAVNKAGGYYPYGEAPRLPDGSPSPPHVREWYRDATGACFSTIQDPDLQYLEKEEDNRWAPVCIAWKSPTSMAWADTVGLPDRGGLFHSPIDLELPTVGEAPSPAPHIALYTMDGKRGMLSEGEFEKATTAEGTFPMSGIDLVPIEHLFWVMDPERLCEPITGKPFDHGARTPEVKSDDHSANKEERKRRLMDYHRNSLRRAIFRQRVAFCSYVLSQLRLLTQICRGRAYNCIHVLEHSGISLSLLYNISTNPWLPYQLRAPTVLLMLAMYVDRFPNKPKCGNSHLPDQIWVCHDSSAEMGARNFSRVSIIDENLNIDKPEAIPEFFLPYASSAFQDEHPVMNFRVHTKYWLLRTLCNNAVASLSGKCVHDQRVCGGVNVFIEAVLEGQATLLELGFQSNITKLRQLCGSNGALLDGRDDEQYVGQHFDPRGGRFDDGGGDSMIITKIKRQIIDGMFTVCDLRANYRLARLLGFFKLHSQRFASPHEMKKWASSPDAMVKFESLFATDGSKEDLNLWTLCNKADFEDALIDLLMYNDDRLFSASLHLLQSTYVQRKSVLDALQKCCILENERLSIFGDVHTLKASIDELDELISTYSGWCVHSKISGPFGDAEFGRAMYLVDVLLLFIYAKEVSSHSHQDKRGTSADRSPPPFDRVRHRLDEQIPSSCSMKIIGVLNRKMDQAGSIHSAEGLFHGRSNPIDYESFEQAVRVNLNVSDDELAEFELKVAFDEMSNGDTTVEAEAFRAYFMGAGPRANYGAIFADCDADVVTGKVWVSRNLWSIDVAQKWLEADANAPTGLVPTKRHQSILRACNLQTTIAQGLNVEPDLAFKGSLCTVAQKVESQRRMRMLSRAICVLQKAFVKGNARNQDIAKGNLTALRHVALEGEMKDELEGRMDERVQGKVVVEARHTSTYKPRSGTIGVAGNSNPWPSSTGELAQDTILAILHKNESVVLSLGEGTSEPHPLFEEYALLADLFDPSKRDTAPKTLAAERRAQIRASHHAPTLNFLPFRTHVERRVDFLRKKLRSDPTVKVTIAGEAGDKQYDIDPKPMLGKGIAQSQWADKDLGHFYEEFIKVLDKELLSLYDDFPKQVNFGKVSGNAASKTHYQVWGANAINVAVGRGNKIEGGGMARAFDTQQPGVFGIVTTPKHGAPDNDEDYGEYGDGGKRSKSKPARVNIATKRTHFPETSPALDFFFIMMCPNGRAIKEFQNFTAALLVNNSDFKNLHHDLLTCVHRAQLYSPSASQPDHFNDEDPFRMLRLLHATVMNGNGETALLLAQGTLGRISVDVLSDCLVFLVDRFAEFTPPPTKGEKGNQGPTEVPRKATQWRSSISAAQVLGTSTASHEAQVEDIVEHLRHSVDLEMVRGAAVLEALASQPRLPPSQHTLNSTTESTTTGGAAVVLKLLVEFIELLPLSEEQVRSGSIWRLLVSVCGPATDALARKLELTMADIEVGRDVIDLLDCLLSKCESLGSMRDLMSDQKRSGVQILDDVQSDLRAIRKTRLAEYFSQRTLEAVERIIETINLRGYTLPVRKYMRAERYKYDDYDLGPRAAAKLPSMPIDLFQQSADAFLSGIDNNPRIKMVLQRRSFAFTAKLSRGVPLGQADVPPGTYTGAVQLDWSQIVARMVKYCNNHFFVKSRIDDVDASTPRRHTVRHDDCTRTCILVFKILIDYLRMLRTFPLDNGGTRVMENTPTSFFQHSPSPNSRKHLKRPVFDDPRVTSLKTYDFFELSEDELAVYEAAHEELDALGVTVLVSRVIMTHTSTIEGDLSDVALELLNELLHGGNHKVRRTFFQWIVNSDTEGKFLWHLKQR